MMARKEVVAYQYRLDGPPKPRSRFVYEPGEFAMLREQVLVEDCLACGERIVGKRVVVSGYFDPWSPLDRVEPDYTDYYCQSCSDRGAEYEGDFSPMWCDWCGRDVIQRCPQNGYRGYFADAPDGNDYVCVGCIQRFYFEHGHTDEQIEGRTIPCDWYDHSELRAKGWEEGEEFDADMLERSGGEEWRDYCRLLKLAGAIVLTDQGRTSIIGGPDSVTVWFKLPERQEEEAT
jgi:hypothetical protein